MSSETDLYFRQIALGDMANLVYLIGSVSTRQCLIVDPAWDIDGLLGQAQEDGMEVVGALATHYHQDHIGGKIFGMEIQGLDHLQESGRVRLRIKSAGFAVHGELQRHRFRPRVGRGCRAGPGRPAPDRLPP